MSIAENVMAIRSRMEAAAKKAGREPSEIKLVAATKDVPVGLIIEAIQAGITDIGENRVQEAKMKIDALSNYPAKWHMIGHLQTNKINAALQMFSVIQSVDSLPLAQEISAKAEKRVEVFIEVNTSGESSKYGVDPAGAMELAVAASKLPNLILTGLMTVGPLTNDERKARESFRRLYGLFETIKGLNLPGVELKYKSMGMSSDFETAIEEGSNLVRIGTAIFGIEHKRR